MNILKSIIRPFAQYIVLGIYLFASWDTTAQNIDLQTSQIAPKIVQISWSSPDSCLSPFYLYRSLPGQNWEQLSDDAVSPYRDTIPMILCGDTIRYKVLSPNGLSPVCPIAMIDNLPTSPCTICVASVEDSSQHIILSWNPNPDPDILGYYLCSGFPCTDYDTIWGAENTTYTCEDLSATESHTFRLLAFDSCMNAGPLTDPLSNMVFSVSADTATRNINAQWTQYQNMPSGVKCYKFYFRYGLDTPWMLLDSLPSSRFQYSFSTSENAALHIYAKVVALNTDGTLTASSNTDSCYLPPHNNPNDTTPSDTALFPLVLYPNIFTPGLPTNNIFLPIVHQLDPDNYALYIFNRHGGRVFFSDNPSLGWDGTYHGEPCPQGSYIFHLRVRHYSGGVCNYTGNILLIR